MVSKSMAVFVSASMLFSVYGFDANAQDIEDFKARMARAAAMTKEDLNEALLQYLEIRVQYAGPEVDYSLGRAYQRLNQCVEAQDYYTKVMIDYNLAQDNVLYTRSVSNYDTIADCKSWQKVYLTCTIPPKGYVMIDDEKISQCWDRPYYMSDGMHQFRLIDADGKEIAVDKAMVSGGEDIHIVLKPEEKVVEVERIVEKECQVVAAAERFHPALYWGLIAGGIAVAGMGGYFAAYTEHAQTVALKYDDLYTVVGKESFKTRANEARDDAQMGRIIMYSAIGLGSALAISGITIAIVNAVGKKDDTASETSTGFVAPYKDGFVFGLGLTF